MPATEAAREVVVVATVVVAAFPATRRPGTRPRRPQGRERTSHIMGIQVVREQDDDQ